MTSSPEPGLWAFSTTLYAHDPVREAALALQAAGLDVNIAFWVVWSVQSDRDPVPVLDAAIELAAQWHALAVGPLRGVRDRLKHPAPPIPAEPAQALRREVLAAELSAERIAQTLLEGLAAPSSTGLLADADSVLRALEHYAARAGASAPVAQFKEAIFSAMKKE